jgi:FAD/FMN-containing dehydrogenase
MRFPHSRRQFLRRTTTGIVTAFVPTARIWATTAPLPPSAVPIPPLDGHLVLVGDIVEAAASDFGRVISRQPFAVLQPGSVTDIATMVAFARKHTLTIGAMGKVGESHSTFGQAQVDAGIVIDMARLNQIHAINDDNAVVDGGVRWVHLLAQTIPLGKAPPTLTDYVNLSIGGTLAVGGIGGQAFRHGFQVDNVLELEVVTGRGQRVTCSPTQRPFLFTAVRAGLGQCGVIVRARVRLVDVPSHTRTYTALYGDLQTLMRDQERLVQEGRFDYIEGQAVPNQETGSGWVFLLEAVKYFAADAPPDDEALLAGLAFIAGSAQTVDRSFVDFANRLAPSVELLRQLGLWELPHPWFDMFVPGAEAAPFIQGVLDHETSETMGPGSVILIYPFLKSKVTTRFLALPDSEITYLFSLLRTTPPLADPHDQVQRNRAIYEDLRLIGGKRYAISSVPFCHDDWQDHFGAQWRRFVLAKVCYDPHNVLTPGQGIFSLSHPGWQQGVDH